MPSLFRSADFRKTALKSLAIADISNLLKNTAMVWNWVACKPGSVLARAMDGYSSRTSVTRRLKRPTRAAAPET